MAIAGIGVDACDPRRIAAIINRRGDGFARKILGPQEWLIYQQRSQHQPSRGMAFVASRFAAKEALGKALGTGVAGALQWHHAQCLPCINSGKPEWHFSAQLLELMQRQQWQAHISLSDEKHVVIAMVVLERQDKAPV